MALGGMGISSASPGDQLQRIRPHSRGDPWGVKDHRRAEDRIRDEYHDSRAITIKPVVERRERTGAGRKRE